MLKSSADAIANKVRYGTARRHISRRLRRALPISELSEIAVQSLALVSPRRTVQLTRPEILSLASTLRDMGEGEPRYDFRSGGHVHLPPYAQEDCAAGAIIVRAVLHPRPGAIPNERHAFPHPDVGSNVLPLRIAAEHIALRYAHAADESALAAEIPEYSVHGDGDRHRRWTWIAALFAEEERRGYRRRQIERNQEWLREAHTSAADDFEHGFEDDLEDAVR